MIIYPPSLAYIRDEVQISAKIELQTKKRKAPRHLWFRFPKKFEDQISLDSDPFVVALLLLAMHNAEPIQVTGTLSRQLWLGLQEYQKIFHHWYPERFHLVEIQCSGFRSDSFTPEAGSACAFSGGVDSFYTFLELLRNREETQLTHALFMAGFDMPLHLIESTRALTSSYASLMEDLGIQWIAGSTNVRGFVNTVDWTNAHGQALAASALFFKRVWKQFYIPSSYLLNSYPKWGTHPKLDPLLSTEALQFIHHGAEFNRVAKLTVVSKSPETYDRLRVCWKQDIGLRNCGQCEKCIRTMVALDILGKLDRYSTFGSQKLDRSAVRNLKMRTYQARLFAKELIKEAYRRGNYKSCVDLGYALLKREIFRKTNRYVI